MKLLRGDCMELLAKLPANSADAVVTDQPYHLASIVKRFATVSELDVEVARKTPHRRTSGGFMGKQWDGGDIAFDPATWAAVLRVLKPGGHMLAFAAPRNDHRMVCAIEDAGFEIRDKLMWLHGQGFPKNKNALKPAYEPICLARKPLDGTIAGNVLKHGTGGLNIDGCRVGEREKPKITDPKHGGHTHNAYGAPSGGGKLLPPGRWPANILHDGSAEVVALFPESKSGKLRAEVQRGSFGKNGVYGNAERDGPGKGYDADSGSAARFFYCAKASKADRAGSKHPTVKPIKLMRYLVRLITPPGGTVLDPFAGSGTTGQAAKLEGCKAILIEREPEYQADIERRLAA
jgi:site-specific DNA-methyltransferase (adenine-specific)